MIISTGPNSTCEMFLMPAAKGSCPVCATEHDPDMPHNRDSLFYNVKFKMEHGHAPTWADAMAHCAPEIQAAWREELAKHGVEVDG